MSERRLEDLEERMMVLRDKAAQENINIPEEVLGYLSEKYHTPQALRGALLNVSAYAIRRRIPITLEVARYVLDGIRIPRVMGTPTPHNSVPATEDGSAVQENPAVTQESEIAAQESEVAEQVEIPAEEKEITAEQIAHHLAYDCRDICPEAAQPSIYGQKLIISSVPEEAPVDTLFDLMEGDAKSDSYDTLVQTLGESVVDHAQEEAPSVADVYFVPMRTQRKKSLIERMATALNRAGLENVIEQGDKVAIKVHFGEVGNTGFVSPIYVREVVRLVKELGGKPFLTDANTLYSGMRDNAIDHLTCAIQHGFSYATVEAPLIIADGLDGRSGVEVRIDGKHFESVRLGSAAAHADAMIVISHVKGHGESGFGGALKNVGMGLGTRAAKQRMHSGIKPHVEQEKCTKCGRCKEWCPVDCITIGPEPTDRAFIVSEACIGCGECVAACAYDAIGINWETDKAAFQEKMVEHAFGITSKKEGKMAYLSFLTNISPECDCWSFSDAPIVPDIGVLASSDIVAIEQASLDLITQAVGIEGSVGEGLGEGVEKFHAVHDVNGYIAIKYAELLGMGTTEYDLKTIG